MKIFNRYPSDIAEKLSLKMKSKAKKLYLNGQAKKHQWFSKNKPIKILCVFDRSCNLGYLERVLRLQRAWGWVDYKLVNLTEYLNEDENLYDLLIYQTWSCEVDYAPLSDQKFISSSLPKVFFDAHASGSFDTYYRFHSPEIPRIKNAPSESFLKDFEVILRTTHPVDIIKERDRVKEVDISYCVGLQTHEVRPKIYEKVMPYQSRCRVDLKNNQHNYVAYLRRVQISVNAPGYGEGTFRHLYSLNAKSLLFAHDSIKPIYLLPQGKLIESEDYIAFNLENFDEKMDWCLTHPKEVKEIQEKGFQTFIQGYSYTQSAKDLYPKLLDLLKQATYA